MTSSEKSVFERAIHKGIVGGTSGALAMTIQVCIYMYVLIEVPTYTHHDK